MARRKKTETANDYDIIIPHVVAAESVMQMNIPNESKVAILRGLGINFSLVKKGLK